MKLFKFKRIALGDFVAQQFTLFEHKGLFSIIAYRFKGDGWQDRFHTHAFNAISFRVYGTYQERVREADGSIHIVARNTSRFRFFTKAHEHMLGVSSGCLTILVAGPWDQTWTERKQDVLRILGWGRKPIHQRYSL